jgi:hypothetical protein|tara:strand:- start:564 stop:797 length:234 start_codon:yes stop_codon:yes gene_type:complete
MRTERTEVREFNGGRTTMHIEYSVMNIAWFVWRDDSGYVSQQMLKTFPTYAEAKADFDARCDFLETVQTNNEAKETR